MFAFNISLLRLNGKYRREIIELQNEFSEITNKLNFLSLKEDIQWSGDGYQISDTIFVNSDKWEKFRTDSLNWPMLVFYYSGFHCNMCVDSEIQRLNKFSNIIGENHIMLFANYRTDRELMLFKRLNQIHYSSFRVRDSAFKDFKTPFDGPFFFVVDKNLDIKKFFVPDKNNPQLTGKYFKNIESYFTVSKVK